jgi:beta-1,4-mannosyl-glycoprotein beta-1,4-N-acetylglucosaminyltransferase
MGAEPTLLKLRCEEMKDLKCEHLIIESAYTFTGIEKLNNFYRQFNNDFTCKYNIRHQFYKLEPFLNPWANEKTQRNLIYDFLLSLSHTGDITLEDDDIIIISDLDEIPRASAIAQYKTLYGMCALQMDMYAYYLNCQQARQGWNGARIMPWSYLKTRTPEEVRRSGYLMTIYEGGWHFTFQGGVQAIQEKLKSFSHQEEGVQRINDRDILEDKIAKGESLWNTEKWPFTLIDDRFPKYLRDNIEEFKHLIHE